jgi:N4-(beta-N-acetylglucosaminyl)-L-asparaginase
MQSRRKFIKRSAVASLALAMNPLDLMAKEFPENNKTVNKPIVLSTWNFGLKANEEAWTILGKGGRFRCS